MSDWPTSFFGDIEQFKRKCPVCGGKVDKKNGLFWFCGETVSFYHRNCAAELVDGLRVDVTMTKIKEMPF